MGEMMDLDTPYFHKEDGHYVPTRFCSGYWSPGSLNGRIVCGLLGHVLEEAFGAPDLVPVRFTVDMLGLMPDSPIRVETDVVRSGRRATFANARLWSGDAMLAQASVIFVRTSANPKAATFQTPRWNVPSPGELPLRPNNQLLEMKLIPSTPGLSAQNAQGASRLHPEGRRYWMRDPRRLVSDADNSSFVRIALLADFASPLSNGSAVGLDFINTDVTLYLNRLPAGDWFGFEFMRHNADHGIAIGECWIHDEIGPLGSINVAAIANSPRKQSA